MQKKAIFILLLACKTVVAGGWKISYEQLGTAAIEPKVVMESVDKGFFNEEMELDRPDKEKASKLATFDKSNQFQKGEFVIVQATSGHYLWGRVWAKSEQDPERYIISFGDQGRRWCYSDFIGKKKLGK